MAHRTARKRVNIIGVEVYQMKYGGRQMAPVFVNVSNVNISFKNLPEQCI